VVNLVKTLHFDFGLNGYKQTLKILNLCNITVVGAGNNIALGDQPLIGKIKFWRTHDSRNVATF